MLVTLGQACPKQAHMARLNSSVETVGSGGGDLGCHKTAAKIIRKLIKKRIISDTNALPEPVEPAQAGYLAQPMPMRMVLWRDQGLAMDLQLPNGLTI